MTNKEFILNFVKYSAPSIVSVIISIFAVPYISRIYPADEYGYISNFYSIGNTMITIMMLGLDGAYIRFFYNPPNGTTRNGMFFLALKTGFFFSAVCTALLLLFHKEVSVYLFNDENIYPLILLSLYVLILVCYRLLNINLRFSNQARQYGIQQISFIIANRLFYIFIAFITTSYIYSVSVMTFSTLLIVVISFSSQKGIKHDIRISKSGEKELLRYAVPLIPSTAITLLNNSIAKILLGGLGYRDEVGILALATSVANLFSIVPSAFGNYWAPFMFEYYKTEKNRIKKTHDVVIFGSFIIVILIVLAQGIVYSILGSNYRASQPYFMLIMLTPITNFIGETTVYGLAIEKKTGLTCVLSLIGCLLNYILCIKLIPIYGAIGAAFSIAISGVVHFLLKSIFAQKLYESVESKSRSLLCFIVIFFLCAGNIWYYNRQKLQWLICFGFFFFILYIYKSFVISFIIKFVQLLKKDKNELP